jgi:hypothetical protein
MAHHHRLLIEWETAVADDRPYRDYDMGELLELLKTLERVNHQNEKKHMRIQYDDPEESASLYNLILENYKKLSVIRAELAARREERKHEREQRESQTAGDIDFLAGLSVEELVGMYGSWRASLRRMRSGELRQMKKGYGTKLNEARQVSDTRTQAEMTHRMAIIDATLRDRGHA